MVWIGRIVSAVPILMLLFSGGMKVVKPDLVEEEWKRLGWEVSSITAIGIVELACTLIYAFPYTAVLGARLLTGYLGGATATHVRIGDPYYNVCAPIVFGVLVWAGLSLRDSRLRVLLSQKG
jgi:hypothetical protein